MLFKILPQSSLVLDDRLGEPRAPGRTLFSILVGDGVVWRHAGAIQEGVWSRGGRVVPLSAPVRALR